MIEDIFTIIENIQQFFVNIGHIITSILTSIFAFVSQAFTTLNTFFAVLSSLSLNSFFLSLISTSIVILIIKFIKE